MDVVEFQEKMDPNHRAMLCRMISEKELPEDLLERYAQVKRLVDRIDGHLTPGDLAMIIYVSGIYAKTTRGIDASPLDESDDKVIENAVEPINGTDHWRHEGVEPPEEQVSFATGHAVEKPKEGIAMLWSPKMPVKVLQNDEIKQGKIFAVHPADDDTPVQLTVEFEGGETVTVNEDEVEAI